MTVPGVVVAGMFVLAAITPVAVLVTLLSDRLNYARDWLAGNLAGLPIVEAVFGCDDCGAGERQSHRYAGCPRNVRHLESGIHPNTLETAPGSPQSAQEPPVGRAGSTEPSQGESAGPQGAESRADT